MEPLKKPVIVIGGGSHAKVCLDLLKVLGHEVAGFSDPNSELGKILGFSRLGSDADIEKRKSADFWLVNGIGSMGDMSLREQTYSRFKKLGFSFLNLVHPFSFVSEGVELGEGIQVMAGAVIQVGSRIGENSLINTRASIDHDAKIGAHCHVAPGVTLSGSVTVGDRTHIGTGASVIQGIQIGDQVTIGAGAVIIRNVPSKNRVVGVPGKAEYKQ